MTRKIKASLFDNDVAIFSFEEEEQGPFVLEDGTVNKLGSGFRWSGRLSKQYEIDTDQSLAGTGFWCMCASRRGTAVIERQGGQPDILVEPGRPAVFYDSNRIRVSPLPGRDADIELSLGKYNFNEDPENMLVLNAGEGVVLDSAFTNEVASWQDVRPTSFAPLPFTELNSSSRVRLIASDPTFNGRASIDFRNSDEAGFEYPDASSDTFDVFRVTGSDTWSCMMIMCVEDAGERQYLWEAEANTDTAGFRMDPAYRPATYTQNFAIPLGLELIEDDEIVEKATVVLWNYDGNTLSQYRQGQWFHRNLNGSRSSTGTSQLRLCNGPFHGKIADIRWKKGALTAEEIAEYLDMATNEYGVDDTQEAVFPFVTHPDTVNFHRSNRGTNSPFSAWVDVREETAANFSTLPATNMAAEASPYAAGHPSLHPVDTDPAFIIGTFSWTHLSGAHDFAIAIITWSGPPQGLEVPLFSMGSYSDISPLDGMNIWSEKDTRQPTFTLKDEAGADVVEVAGPEVTQRVPWLYIVTCSANNELRVISYDIARRRRAYDHTEAFSGVTGDGGALRLLYWAANYSDFPYDGGYLDFFTRESSLSDVDIQGIEAYAARRYNAPPASF